MQGVFSYVFTAVGMVAIIGLLRALKGLLESIGTPYLGAELEDGTQVWRGPGGVRGPRDFAVVDRDGTVEIREIREARPIAVQAGAITYGRALDPNTRQFNRDESSIEAEIKKICGALRQRLLSDLKLGVGLLVLLVVLALLVGLVIAFVRGGL